MSNRTVWESQCLRELDKPDDNAQVPCIQCKRSNLLIKAQGRGWFRVIAPNCAGIKGVDLNLSTFVESSGMGSSSSPKKTRATGIFSRSLLLTSVQVLLLSSSAGTCTGSNSSPGTAIESASWLRRLGNEQKFKETSRRALLQGSDVTSGLLSSTSTVVTVNQFGTGDYATVQEAIDAVPIDNTQRVVIRIYRGTYR